MTRPPLRAMVIVLSVIEEVRLTRRKEVMLTKKPEKPAPIKRSGWCEMMRNDWR